MIVFVYGTLKRGNWLHSHLLGAEYLGKARTVSDQFRMFCNGSYPYVVSDTGYRIIGEIYQVNPDILIRLDNVENGYTRMGALFEVHGVVVSGELYVSPFYVDLLQMREVLAGEWFPPTSKIS